jgi:propanol-preferring alcohol dehydrogenase
MKGVVFLGDRRVAVKEFPVPDPGPGEALVKMEATGICGSDLHVYRRRECDPNRIPGHEPSGTVAAIGEGVENVRVGDRVCVNHYRSCGHCRFCASGYFQWCRSARGYGGPVDGSHAEYLIADERNCVPLPESVSFGDGAFIACAGGTAFSALKKLGVSGETTLAVFGLGPVGLSGVLIGKAMGGTVIGVDVIPERVELARRIGADIAVDATKEDPVSVLRDVSTPDGCDLAFEASGSTSGRQNAVKSLRRGGRAVFCGVGSTEATLNPTDIIGRELTLMGSFVISLGMSYEMAQFLAAKKVSFDPLVTHRFPFGEGVEAYRVADESRTGKVLFVAE